jgi:hypothetical protein
MSFTGHWTIELHSPTGIQTLRFNAVAEAGALTGTISNGTDSGQILNGQYEGDEARWNLPIHKPISVTLAFDATLEADAISGTAKIGNLGTAKFTGTRNA